MVGFFVFFFFVVIFVLLLNFDVVWLKRGLDHGADFVVGRALNGAIEFARDIGA